MFISIYFLYQVNFISVPDHICLEDGVALARIQDYNVHASVIQHLQALFIVLPEKLDVFSSSLS